MSHQIKSAQKKKRRMPRNKILRLVEAFEGEINNGGFDQFFFNSIGNETAEIVEALKTIGASKIANILERAAKRFPEGKPPKDRFARQDLLRETVSPHTDAFDDLDREFYSCSEDLQGFLEKYMDWI